MKLGIGNRVLRVMTAVVTTVSITIVSCTAAPVTPPPVGGQGPQFVINSPVAGGFTAGTFFFSVQPFDASEVQRVDFEVAGVAVGSDSTAVDGFRVAILASDYAAGEVSLRAMVVGTDGRTRTQTVMVENVPMPPSSTTVGAEGAVLGTARGSTLGIRPGDAVGASVSFTEQTQAEVKAATGVDYAALGVTFLGAQEVDSDVAIEDPLMVSSADFASFVQGGQAVVNYTIAPDADGDDVGELVVVNSASVAGDDIVSDPVPELQLGQVQIRNQRGTTDLHTHQQGISGPPGTILSFVAVGFNALSAYGNIATFESQGETLAVPGVVTPELDGAEAEFHVVIPPLPQGPATMTIVSSTTGSQVGPIDLIIEASPVTTVAAGSPGSVFEQFLTDAIDFMNTLPADEPDASRFLTDGIGQFGRTLAELQGLRAGLESEPNADIEELLGTIDTLVTNAGIFSGQGSDGIFTQELPSDAAQLLADYLAVITVIGAVIALFTVSSILAAIAAGIALGVGLIGVYLMIERRFRPGCEPAINAIQPLVDFLAPGTIPGMLLGMGSTPPAGGSGCGSASGGAGASASIRTQQTEVAPILVKVLVGGSPLPFTGVADASGYFYIPIIPEGEPFTAIATDISSNEVRTFEGIGPPLGESVYMIFDFFNDDDAPPTIPINANTSGDLELDETDLYTFVGTAGQLITLGTQGAPDFVEQYKLDLFAPNSNTDLAPAVGLGKFYSETGVVVLPDSGVYTLSVASNFSASGIGSGTYHVGLSEIAEPIPIDVTSPLVTIPGEQTVYGDRHFFSFSAQAGDIHKFSLSLPGDSLFNATLDLLGPDSGPEPFYDRPKLIGSGTFVEIAKPLGVTAPLLVLESGEYIVEIQRGNSPSTIEESLGAWEFSVLTPDPATAIAIGDTVMDDIGLPGEIDLFTFTATAGQMVDFQTQDLDPEVDQVNWSVTAPDGSEIFDDPLFSDPGTFTLAQGGSYTVMVGSDNDPGTGAYTLSIVTP